MPRNLISPSTVNRIAELLEMHAEYDGNPVAGPAVDPFGRPAVLVVWRKADRSLAVYVAVGRGILTRMTVVPRVRDHDYDAIPVADLRKGREQLRVSIDWLTLGGAYDADETR